MNTRKHIKKTGQISLKGVNILLTIVVLIILPLVVFTLISSKTNKLGGIKSFVVLTGSMTPNLNVGSVVFTKPNPSYTKGDVIAFKSADRTITHRIIEVKGAKTFVTKGDANNAADSDPVSENKIVGKQIFYIPYLGKFIVFLSTVQGFLLFIAGPIIVFVIFELWNIKKEMEKQIEARVFKEMFAKKPQ